MVEGDNSSRETDKDGDIYHNYRVNYVYITFDGAQILTGSLVHPPSPLRFSCFVCIPLPSCLPPHTPFSQYVAHSCFGLTTVLLINWWVCGCNKTHDSRWTIHLLPWNFSNDTESSSHWALLEASIHPGTTQLLNQSVLCHWLWLWFIDDKLAHPQQVYCSLLAVIKFTLTVQKITSTN